MTTTTMVKAELVKSRWGAYRYSYLKILAVNKPSKGMQLSVGWLLCVEAAARVVEGVSPRAQTVSLLSPCFNMRFDSDAFAIVGTLARQALVTTGKHALFAFDIGTCGIHCVGASFSRVRRPGTSDSRFKEHGLADGQPC
jgi:hypothetical protein